ncbi:Holliday junction resolvase RuvX [Paenalcaligenes niemegkensis]|uniref:Holliday junction resolvase RuvX n=1 Tax=Paenalcaligenes niemegkensis TaxID=2895469 RepID=UPI001EE922A7|nr:Holliday junction resolvase RuvX [Paenalcaligenes niemegkensis]MCQ9615469.1 Holliday junction resolvase RuvX [Paenalcaligenes niemegkensis]
MPELTLLAFDYGLKKIGVAIGNTLTCHARPLCILKPVTRQQRFEAISLLIHEWQPDKIIVGLPLTTEGGEQYASMRCRRFANQLYGRYGLDVELVDERGSSIEAQDILANNDDDDAVAAAVILQRWLDTQADLPTP